MKSEIIFGNEKLKISLEKLKDSKTEDRKLYGWIIRNIKEDLNIDSKNVVRLLKKPGEFPSCF